MHNYWEQRYNWQINTLAEMRRNLGFSGVQCSAHSSSKYIIMFGYPQNGKTALLLRIIGIKDDKSINHIYKILRAEQSAGSSSTSTAIIYHRSISNTDQWGLKKEYIGKADTFEINWLPEKDVVSELKAIRSQIENYPEELKENDTSLPLLHIYLPQNYFKSNKDDGLHIVDFPGIESTNDAEAIYVRWLALRYVALASRIVIVCGANQLTSLEKLYIPGYEDICWLDQPYKYMIIPTRVYTSQKGLYDEHNKEDFSLYCIKTCREAFKKQLHVGENFKIYPVELGESLTNLEGEFSDEKNPAFFKSIRDNNNKILNDIYENLLKEGDSFPLLDKISYANTIDRRYNDWCDYIKKRQGKFEALLNSKQKALEESELKMKSSNDYLEKLNKDLEDLRRDYSYMVNCVKCQYNVTTSSIISCLFADGKDVKDYDHDKGHLKLQELLDKLLFSEIRQTIESTFEKSNYLDSRNIIKILSVTGLLSRGLDKGKLHELFERKITVFGKILFGKKIFGKTLGSRLSKNEVCEKINKLIYNPLKIAYNDVLEQLKPNYTKQKCELEKEKTKIEDYQIILSIRIERLKRSAEIIKIGIEDCKQKRLYLAEEKDEKLAVIKNWQNIAHKYFAEQYNSLIDIVNSNASEEDKINAFLVSSMITNDLENLLREGNIRNG